MLAMQLSSVGIQYQAPTIMAFVPATMFVADTGRAVCWVIALALSYGVSRLAGLDGWRIEPAHFSERSRPGGHSLPELPGEAVDRILRNAERPEAGAGE